VSFGVNDLNPNIEIIMSKKNNLKFVQVQEKALFFGKLVAE
jgi:hypothetical protein